MIPVRTLLCGFCLLLGVSVAGQLRLPEQPVCFVGGAAGAVGSWRSGVGQGTVALAEQFGHCATGSVGLEHRVAPSLSDCETITSRFANGPRGTERRQTVESVAMAVGSTSSLLGPSSAPAAPPRPFDFTQTAPHLAFFCRLEINEAAGFVIPATFRLGGHRYWQDNLLRK